MFKDFTTAFPAENAFKHKFSYYVEGQPEVHPRLLLPNMHSALTRKLHLVSHKSDRYGHLRELERDISRANMGSWNVTEESVLDLLQKFIDAKVWSVSSNICDASA